MDWTVVTYTTNGTISGTRMLPTRYFASERAARACAAEIISERGWRYQHADVAILLDQAGESRPCYYSNVRGTRVVDYLQDRLEGRR